MVTRSNLSARLSSPTNASLILWEHALITILIRAGPAVATLHRSSLLSDSCGLFGSSAFYRGEPILMCGRFREFARTPHYPSADLIIQRAGTLSNT
jgi:hypothetical protein